MPPENYCPLCPTQPGGFPTEIPLPSYDIVVFENKFPSLSPAPPSPAVEGSMLMPVLPAAGVCEVVCYTDDHDSTFAELPSSQVRKLTRVWRDRYMALSEREGIAYVFIFENKGKEIGVTLTHPHGQIYAYPYIPPVAARELASERSHHEASGRPLMGDWLAEEVGSGKRVVAKAGRFVAIVPFFARYPYEVWVAPTEHLTSLAQMSPADLDALGELLSVVAKKLDRLFGFSMPYIMCMHQEPTIPGYGFTWFHVEFYPPYRTATKLKYLAGSEAGAGAFINDTLPEETAERLRNA